MSAARLSDPRGTLVRIWPSTSTASVLFTAIPSTHGHHGGGTMIQKVLRAFAPGLIFGSIAGPQLAVLLSGHALAAILNGFDGPVWVDTAPSRVLEAAGQPRFRVYRR